jgi:hypothetical protein
MTHEKARRVLIPIAVCAALLGVLLVLTANLDDIALGPGELSRKADSADGPEETDSRGGLVIDVGFLRHVLFAAFTASLTIVLLGALFTRFLRRWLYFAIGLFGALIVFDLFVSRLPSRADIERDALAPKQAVATFADPQSPEWSRILIAVGLSVGAGAALILGSSWVATQWRARRSRRRDGNLAWELELLAEQTLFARQDPDVVLHCYREMVDLLSRKEQVAHVSLTAREFAERLRNLGLCTEAIDRLTKLFELVRYGHRASAPFTDRALHSLEEIREANRPSTRLAH